MIIPCWYNHFFFFYSKSLLPISSFYCTLTQFSLMASVIACQVPKFLHVFSLFPSDNNHCFPVNCLPTSLSTIHLNMIHIFTKVRIKLLSKWSASSYIQLPLSGLSLIRFLYHLLLKLPPPPWGTPILTSIIPPCYVIAVLGCQSSWTSWQRNQSEPNPFMLTSWFIGQGLSPTPLIFLFHKYP